MDALAEQLDAKLREWTPETAAHVRQRGYGNYRTGRPRCVGRYALAYCRARSIGNTRCLHTPVKYGLLILAGGKTRPVVVVSRDDPDPPRALILYVPLTTKDRQSPYEVVLPRLPFLEQNSVANVQVWVFPDRTA